MAKSREQVEVEKRIMEAEKVVISSMLHRWKMKFGMHSVLVVQNSFGNVFSRVSVGQAALDDEGMVVALENAIRDLRAIQAQRAKK